MTPQESPLSTDQTHNTDGQELRGQLVEALHESLCSACFPAARTGFLFASADAQKAVEALLPLIDAHVAGRVREARADELDQAIDRVRSVYAMHCPVEPSRYVNRWAVAAHQWWETVLGGRIRELADRLTTLRAEAQS